MAFLLHVGLEAFGVLIEVRGGLWRSLASGLELLSRFLPHLPLARVLPYPTAERPHVEPYDPSWGCPKRFRPNPEPGE